METNFFLSQFLIWVVLILSQLHGNKSCIVNERKAILELKKYLISRTEKLHLNDVFPTWTNDPESDCCLWDGIKCNLTSKKAIYIDIGVSAGAEYFNSVVLNLSLLHPFEELRSLNLSGGRYYNAFAFAGFFDDVEVYKSLRKLRNLEVLDLSSNGFNNSIFPFLNEATSLKTLNLHNNMVEVLSFKGLKNLTNLESLDLSSNYVISMRDLIHLKNLKALDLSSSTFASSMVLQDLKSLTNLEVLGLANNNLDGPIPIEVVCGMKNLRELNLKQNSLVGQLPHCLSNLKKLQVLDLSSNQFTGTLPSSFTSLASLEYLSLLDNNFTTTFSLNPLTNLTNLKVLKLSSTSHKLQVETKSTWLPKFQLSVVILRFCNLKKTIPSFLMNQKNLHLLDLSNNRLSGDIPTWLFENNQELKVLQLQNNSFTVFQMPTRVNHLKVLDISANHIGGMLPNNIGLLLPNLIEMNSSHNELQGQFPESISEMKNISLLDLSYNNFSKNLPQSFLTDCFSLKYLILSHNKFTGHCLPRGTSFTSLRILRIDNNLFSGKLEVGLLNSTKLLSLDISNNHITGVIPSWISMFSSLHDLSLSNNLLQGSIPSFSSSLVDLAFLDLSGNFLSGALPSHMRVPFLYLNNNNFTGPIPNTFLEGVRLLSLGNNKLSSSIPHFVNTEDIRILLLRGNSLTGSIPRQLCEVSTIEVLDLSNNNLNGSIPSCFFNLSFGVGEDEMRSDLFLTSITLERFQLDIYKYTFVIEELLVDEELYKEIGINLASKKRYDLYSGARSFTRGILDYMYGMDLSNNELSGHIPTELGELPKLKVLNLSHNVLSSSIPSSFSNLADIESLDLSYNKLHGRIPYQLTNLTFLQVFDVSHNNLSGAIPRGKQFSTFNVKSFLGNPLLCGPQINVSCENQNRSYKEEEEEEEEENEDVIDMLVFYYSSVSVYVTVLIGIVVLMCFDCPWRRAWLRIVDGFIGYIQVKCTMFC